MLHPQEVPLVFKATSGALLPTAEQIDVREELDAMADLGLDTQAHEHAYRTQLSRQMLELSKGEG